MDSKTLRRSLIWLFPLATFAAFWAWAISTFGAAGVYVGWLPALILARVAGVLASLVWCLIALAVLLGWHFYASEAKRPSRA